MRLVRYLLERFTNLDWTLGQRFPRRELNRSLALPRAVRHLFGPTSAFTSQQLETRALNVTLGGLEVLQTSASGTTLTVRKGAVLAVRSSPVTETRPGTWSGNDEPDDYDRAMWVLPNDVTALAPPVPLTTATTDVEWWTVYVTPTVQTVETDSAKKVFNELTGVYDSASATKVESFRAVPGVVRGSAGGAIPDPPGTGIPIAWLCVPSGATTLDDAVVFDVRRLLDQPGPNRVGGCWQFATEGELSGTYNQTIFLGHAWARLGQEHLSARAFASTLKVGELAEPGATWDATASPSAPKIAWLYLCKVKGLVPRPVRRGQTPIGNHGTLQASNVLLDGALVLSPTPPRIGASVTAAKAAQSGLRWDLRPSAALTLPGFTAGDMVYNYQGLSVAVDEAICIGFYRYTDVDGVPLLKGSLHVDELGWMRGASISNANTDPAGLFTVPTFTEANGATPRTVTSNNNYGFATITISSVSYPLPLDGARMTILIDASAADHPLGGKREDEGRLWGFTADNHAYPDIERRIVVPGRQYLNEIQFVVNTSTFSGESPILLAVRFPYGEDLVT